tara:strand:- start:784 stop:2079 length:1296 start_codon:yes stop_codon:yes gene_type:complete
MPFKRFGKHDLFYNKVKTFPECNFLIYDSFVYYNNKRNNDERAGKNGDLLGVPQGFISLYELNVDRPIDTGTGDPPDGKSIYPFITKAGARVAFKTISTSVFDSVSQFNHGDIIRGKYPLSSSIKRTFFNATTEPIRTVSHEGVGGSYDQVQGNRKFIYALRNSFNEYMHYSHHFAFDRDSYYENSKIINWDKSLQEASLIEIPSIFYGSSIKKGSVVLQFYLSGTLAAECRDIKRNGELIQVSGTYDAKTNNNKVAGIVLYNEGFVYMTGSWNLNSNVVDKYVGADSYNPSWKYFGAGANDGKARGALTGSMFNLSFKGINYVPTVTMFAHMDKGEYNNSTNPTAKREGYPLASTVITSSKRYEELNRATFHRMEHSEYADPTGSYSKQVYISKVGIYDSQKRLIGIAKLANPIRKTEDREYTFKLKLDM